MEGDRHKILDEAKIRCSLGVGYHKLNDVNAALQELNTCIELIDKVNPEDMTKGEAYLNMSMCNKDIE